MKEDGLSAMLLDLLGAEDFVLLAEKKGGTRLFVPASGWSDLALIIGYKATRKLARRYGGDYIRVPLAKELRARHYRTRGASNAQIALKLGMTETGVNRLFKAMTDKPVKGSADPRQGSLF